MQCYVFMFSTNRRDGKRAVARNEIMSSGFYTAKSMTSRNENVHHKAHGHDYYAVDSSCKAELAK
jgi:hypothetical protein